jgi:tetratricopeptide (TPR) repeat protein
MDDLERARAALDRGDIHDAAGHLAEAIAAAPTRPETHELLSRLAARSGGGLELFPLEAHTYVGAVVARAHLLAAAGRPEDALPLLAAAVQHTPGVDWADVPWVKDPDLAVGIEPGLLARTIMQLCTSVGDPAPPAGHATLAPFLALTRHAVAAHPGHGLLLGAGSALARRIGEIDLAVEWAAQGARVRPSKLAEIWLGYAYRRAGRLPQALAALRRAVTHDPGDLTVYADIAAILAEDGRLDDALRWIDRALQRDPDFDCAVHTGHRLRYRADGDLAHLVRLADFQRDHPDQSHEHTDLAECCAAGVWLSRVPAAATPALDPRRSLPPSRRPALSSAQRLLALAQPGWAHPPAAYDAAIGLMLLEPDELIALLVSPPEEPDDCARVWAALGLLHHRPDEPWASSARRRLLVELAADGVDRITEAALFALVTSAWVDPSARADVAALVSARLRELAPAAKAPAPIAWSVAQLTMATPDMDDATRAVAAAVIRSYTQQPLRRRRRGMRRRAVR